MRALAYSGFDQVDEELGQAYQAGNPLDFVDNKPYPVRMADAQEKTGETGSAHRDERNIATTTRYCLCI